MTGGTGTIVVEATVGSIDMKDGATAATAGGNIRYMANVDVTLACLNAGVAGKVDGITTGYTGSTGFGYTLWSLGTPGTMTLDLQRLYTISSINLLLWDLDGRYYQYMMEASLTGSDWMTVVDRTSGERRGWQYLEFETATLVRYLRLTGTYDSAGPGFHVVEWQVYGS